MTYRHPDVAAVVLAAGMGKRMKSDLAKVLHVMAGKPLLGHVLETLEELGVGRTVAVIGHQREKVQATFAGRKGLEWAIQAEQRGTGHACMMAEPLIRGFRGTVLVVCGDTPLLSAARSLSRMDLRPRPVRERSKKYVTPMAMSAEPRAHQ